MSTLLQPVGDADRDRGGAERVCRTCRRSPGGATRQDSVRAGLEALDADRARRRAGARRRAAADPAGHHPALLAALEHAPGAIPAVPVADTLKRVADGLITATVPRDGLFRAQTPQAFRFAVLLAAHRSDIGAAPPTMRRCWRRSARAWRSSPARRTTSS